VKVKCTPWRHMGILKLRTRWWMITFTIRPVSLPQRKGPFSHRMGGWVGLVVGPDVWWHRKLSSSCRKPNNDPSALQPVANKNSHHKECDIPSSQTQRKWKDLHASVSYWFQQADILTIAFSTDLVLQSAHPLLILKCFKMDPLKEFGNC
jgi:hypothetical protein